LGQQQIAQMQKVLSGLEKTKGIGGAMTPQNTQEIVVGKETTLLHRQIVQIDAPAKTTDKPNGGADCPDFWPKP
jgi:hypothetical protein